MRRPVLITWRHGARFDAISWAMMLALGVGLLTITGRLAAACIGIVLGLLIGIGLGAGQPCSCGHNRHEIDGGRD